MRYNQGVIHPHGGDPVAALRESFSLNLTWVWSYVLIARILASVCRLEEWHTQSMQGDRYHSL